MRTLFTLALAVLMVSSAFGQTPTEEEADRERRAKALLLMSQAKLKCAVSIDAARKEAVKDDKVMVVLVGETKIGCAEVSEAGGIAVKVKEYKADTVGEKTPTAPRVIVLSKGSGQAKDTDTASLYIRDVLPADAKPEAVKEAVRKVTHPPTARPQANAPLNWEVQGPMLASPATGTVIRK